MNVEKKRTIKSPGHGDAEIRCSGVTIEKSVEENWADKIKKDIKKNKGKEINKFVFITNQNAGQKKIKIKKIEVDAVEYCKKELQCKEAFVVDIKDLTMILKNPEFFNIRRNYLGIPNDIFTTPLEVLKRFRENSSFRCNEEESILKKYGLSIAQEVIFSPSDIYVLHNDNYVTLLYALCIWVRDEFSSQDSLIVKDFSFVSWPSKMADLTDIDSKFYGDIETFIIIWGAHEIDNLSEYLRFVTSKTSLIFVTKTSFKDDRVINKLRSSVKNLNIREISIAAIDQKTVSPRELLLQHENKIKLIAQNTIDLVLRLEALIYFYSPLHSNDKKSMRKIAKILKIDEDQLEYLKRVLLENDLADVTGSIIWLKQVGVAKLLLNNYISKDIFIIENLI